MRERAGKIIDGLEEGLIAGILWLMTAITFANVVARYGFNSNILWGLEMTVFLFGWMVLLGASYAVKKNTHLGVDVIVNMATPRWRRVIGLASAIVCVIFSCLMLKGAWDYWANFANLPATDGRWFPLGFEDEYRDQAWYEVNDIPMPDFLRWIEPIFNEGEAYEKIPRFIPYTVLPISMALLLLRFVQAAKAIWDGTRDRLIASHEVEDEMDAVAMQADSDAEKPKGQG